MRSMALLVLAGTALAADAPLVDWQWNGRPEAKIRHVGAIEFRARFQFDARDFTPQRVDDTGTFNFQRRRLGLKGRLFRDFDFEVEYELGDENRSWRDVSLDWRRWKSLRVQGGQFKMPFGLDQLSSFSDLDFITRSRIGDLIAPARDVGVMAHGTFSNKVLTYQAGWFRGSGENSPNAGATFAARVTGQPLAPFTRARWARLRLGAAATIGDTQPGLNGLRGRTWLRYTYFPRYPIYGQRFRLGAEVHWSLGPYTFQSEWMHASDERLLQGLEGEDLPSLRTRGWYTTGTVLLLGRRWSVAERSERAALIRKWRPELPIGVEAAARYERISFDSATTQGIPSRSFFAPRILENSDTIWSSGLNFFLGRHCKVQVNAMRETIGDPRRSPFHSNVPFWTGLLRLTLAM